MSNHTGATKRDDAVVQRITTTLFLAQSLTSAALIAGGTINPIVGAQLSGQPQLAGLPGTLVILGAAGIAYPAGRLMDRIGRRAGLALGMSLGLAGSLVAALAAVATSFAGFLLGLLLIGFARGVSELGRFAAAEIRPPAERARAISSVVFGGTVGAIAGPALVAPMGRVAASQGLDPLVGPMVASAALFGLAALLITLLLRPDPLALGRRLAAQSQRQEAVGEARPLGAILRLPQAQLAVGAMVVGQLVMVLLMSIISLHMTNHDHGLGDVSLVIMAHTMGMYGVSVLTGPLADRLGRPAMIGFGALTLVAGSLLAPLSLATPLIALALFLIGLGWNMCYIAGSSLLADTLRSAERGGAQGASDLTVGLVSASSGLGSGFLLAIVGFGALSIIGATLALIPLALVLRHRVNQVALKAH
jgi:MFS family permease